MSESAIIDVDAQGFSDDGDYLAFTNDLAAVAKHMFDLIPVLVRYPNGQVASGNRIVLSAAARRMMREHVVIEVNKAIRGERRRAGQELH